MTCFDLLSRKALWLLLSRLVEVIGKQGACWGTAMAILV